MEWVRCAEAREQIQGHIRTVANAGSSSCGPLKAVSSDPVEIWAGSKATHQVSCAIFIPIALTVSSSYLCLSHWAASPPVLAVPFLGTNAKSSFSLQHKVLTGLLASHLSHQTCSLFLSLHSCESDLAGYSWDTAETLVQLCQRGEQTLFSKNELRQCGPLSPTPLLGVCAWEIRLSSLSCQYHHSKQCHAGQISKSSQCINGRNGYKMQKIKKCAHAVYSAIVGRYLRFQCH